MRGLACFWAGESLAPQPRTLDPCGVRLLLTDPATVSMANDRQSGGAGWRTAAATLALGTLVAGWAGALIAPAVAIGYGVLSCITFMLYRHDKNAAQAGRMRTRERTLHVIDLLGGWPGGLLAQDRLRHKTRKATFQLVFWATVAINCALLGWLLSTGRLA
jgi:uncharacterized membrane protein YsdA (DUF1294 family)